MKSYLPHLAVLALLTVSLSARAQFYKLHSAEIAVGGTGQFSTSITSQSGLPHQATTDSTGFLFTLHDAPVAWAGIELNYQYTSLSERFVSEASVPLANVPGSMHEATAAYVFHPHIPHIQPFVNVGGGALFFHSTTYLPSQWRGAGLFEIGFDVPTPNRHVGFRVQGRTLLYRAPNFFDAGIASSRWASTEEPSASVYYRF